MAHRHVGRVERLLVHSAALLCVVVLLCVPGLTRITQKLEPVSPASHAPSFSKNIDCPPKKVVVAPSFAITAAVLLRDAPIARVEGRAPSPDTILPLSPTASAPPSLRAPPSSVIA